MRIRECLCILAATAAVLLAACRMDYTEEAVETARAYALENLRGVTEPQRAFVRYTQPVIYENVIFPRYVIPLTEIGHVKMEKARDLPTAPHMDLMHSCVVWSPPDMAGKIVVAGEGERSMRFWTPRRVLVKEYLPSDSAYETALRKCASHAQNDMLYLSTPELNRVRFSEPAEIRFTKFDVAPPDVNGKAGKSEWELYLMELQEMKKQYSQISLIWQGEKEENRIVFTGLTTSGSLAGWKFRTAELMSAAKLEKHLLSPEEIKQITVMPAAPPRLVHPKEEKIDRTGTTATPDTPDTGGSFIYH